MAPSMPNYMQEGSNGPHVTVLQIYLAACDLYQGALQFGTFDGATTEALRIWQSQNNLVPSGNFDRDARRAMRSKGFDFEAACLSVPGITIFIGPRDEKTGWSPDS